MKPFFALACWSILALTVRGAAPAAEPAPASSPARLDVGGPAPAVDVAEWIHPGSPRPVHPFTAFEPGTIYVIEFWATWCEHSRAAIPVLSALREKHGPEVVILAIGVDQPDELRGFLSDSDPDVRELAAQAGTCCIAADPDGSVQDSFMDAAMESELPTAFVVGREGLIEWIGHPVDLEKPLARIVDGSWDRAAFAAEWARLQAPRRVVEQALVLIAQGKAVEAAAALDAFVADEGTTASALNDVAWTLVLRSVYGPLPGGVLAAAERAAAKSVAHDPTSGNALDTLAHVQAVQGRLDEAIATQRRAVAHGGAEANAFRTYLRQLEAARR